jgi:hypothetical protein
MSTPPPHEDVFDPTADPRHKPPVAVPGEGPDAKPRDVGADTPLAPDEPVIAPVKPADRPV